MSNDEKPPEDVERRAYADRVRGGIEAGLADVEVGRWADAKFGKPSRP